LPALARVSLGRMFAQLTVNDAGITCSGAASDQNGNDGYDTTDTGNTITVRSGASVTRTAFGVICKPARLNSLRLGRVPYARFALYMRDEFLIRPPPAIPTPPHLSPNQLARNRPPRHDDAPKVPDFCPRGFRTQPHIVTLYARAHAPVCAVAAPERIARQDRPARQAVSA
jgi:hypothetical protein